MERTKKIVPFKEELDYLFDIYLLTGGFPSVINNYIENRYCRKKEDIANKFYESTIRSVLGDISNTRISEVLARELLKNISERYASRYSFTTIGQSVASSHQVVQDYLELLENSFVVEVMYAVDIPSRKSRFKADKKIYFSDPFIYHALCAHVSGMNGFEVSKENVSKCKDKIIEGVAANHLIQTKEISYQKDWKTYLWYLYTTRGKEIDFVYKKNNGSLLGIELKYQTEVRPFRIDEMENQLILTKNQFQKTQKRILIPVPVFLSVLQKSSRVI